MGRARNYGQDGPFRSIPVLLRNSVIISSCVNSDSHLVADRLVMLGNHRDAWIFGAVDPSSGTAALMEVARALGELRDKGNLHGNT